MIELRVIPTSSHTSRVTRYSHCSRVEIVRYQTPEYGSWADTLNPPTMFESARP